jgi:hypothetical protein
MSSSNILAVGQDPVLLKTYGCGVFWRARFIRGRDY